MGLKFKTLWKLFFVFFKISPVTFGGGYAMISLIEKEVVTKNKWIKEEEIPEVLTIAQTVPGAVAINSAIFIGYHLAGIFGAFFALAGIILPTLIIVIITSFSFYLFYDNSFVKAAFEGIGAAVIALIIYAGYKMGKKSIKDFTTLIIAFCTVVFLCLFPTNPIYLILCGIILGIVINRFRIARRELNKREKVKDVI